MAVIVHDPKRVQALEEIQASLQELAELKTFIEAPNFSLSCGSGRGKHELTPVDTEQEHIRKLLAARHEREAKIVQQKAAKNQIKLEASDLAILSLSARSEGAGGK